MAIVNPFFGMIPNSMDFTVGSLAGRGELICTVRNLSLLPVGGGVSADSG